MPSLKRGPFSSWARLREGSAERIIFFYAFFGGGTSRPNAAFESSGFFLIFGKTTTKQTRVSKHEVRHLLWDGWAFFCVDHEAQITVFLQPQINFFFLSLKLKSMVVISVYRSCAKTMYVARMNAGRTEVLGEPFWRCIFKSKNMLWWRKADEVRGYTGCGGCNCF